MEKEHIHSYIRVRGKKELYMCSDPECKYYANRSLIEGKRAKCPLCGEPFILTRVQLKNKLPRCANCKRDKNKMENDTINELMEMGEGI